MILFSLVKYCRYCLLSLWTLLLIASCRLFWTQPHVLNGTETAFFTLNYLGHYFLIACIATLLIAGCLLLPGIRRYRLTVGTVFIGITFCLGLAVSVVYSVWRMDINHNLLQFAFNPNAGQVIEVSGGFLISLIAMLLLVFSIAWAAAFLSKRFSEQRSHRIANTLLLGGALLYLLAQSWTFIDMRLGKANTLVLTQKLAQYHALSLANGVNHLLPASAKESLTDRVKTILATGAPIQMPPITGKIPSDPPNILLIVVDTLRADMLSPRVMPHTFAFSHHADRFLAHMSGGNCTQPGVFSLFYSIPSTYWDSALLTQKAPPLIDRLQQLHYHIDLLSSAPLTVPNFQDTLFATLPHPALTPGDDAMARDRFVTRAAMRILKRKNTAEKHFTFVFLDSVHSYNSLSSLTTPWADQAALNYLTLSTHTPRQAIVNRYKNAVYFDDTLIGKLLHTLKKNHGLDNTVVIITADHGQSFNDFKQNYWEHASNFGRYELQVPLLIHWPHQTPRVISYRTSHFDVAPTLWHRVLGVTQNPHAWSVGHDLYAHHSSPWIITQNYTDTGLVSPDYLITFYTTGNHYLTNTQLKRLAKPIPPLAIQTLTEESTRFFATKQGKSDAQNH